MLLLQVHLDRRVNLLLQSLKLFCQRWQLILNLRNISYLNEMSVVSDLHVQRGLSYLLVDLGLALSFRVAGRVGLFFQVNLVELIDRQLARRRALELVQSESSSHFARCTKGVW